MMRKLLLLFVAALFLLPASAQLRRSELSVSYGFAPVTGWTDTYTDLLKDLVAGHDTGLKGWGAVTVGYNFRLLNKLSLGVQVVYASNDRRIVPAANAAPAGTATSHYWTVMPNLKWTWLNLRVVSLYSRVGVGSTFSKAEAGGSDVSATDFAFQASPVGVEVGGRLAAYAEAGIGASGCLIFGARYRF